MLTRCVLVLAAATLSANAQVLYVDDDAPPGGDGQSWGTAYRFLQDAVFSATRSAGATEIRIAQGVYYPDQAEATPNGTGSRFSRYLFSNRAASLRGGFRGVDGSGDPNDRNVNTFVTTLSADIGVRGDHSDNAYQHINSLSAPFFPHVFEGLVLRDAFDDVDARIDFKAAGIQVTGLQAIRDCKFINNRSVHDVHDLLVQGSIQHIAVERCIFDHPDSQPIGSQNAAARFRIVDNSIRIQNCRFLNRPAISVSQCDRVIIADSEFQNCSPSIDPDNTRDIEVERCDFRGGANSLTIIHEPTHLSITESEFSGFSRRAFEMFRPFEGTTRVIEECVFRNNVGEQNGPAIAVLSAGIDCAQENRLNVISCDFVDNTVLGTGGDTFTQGSGGAVSIGGSTRFFDCHFINNSATATFDQNGFVRGGGAAVVDGEAAFVSCRFEGNSSMFFGGAILSRGAQYEVNRCEFVANRSGQQFQQIGTGAIHSDGPARIINSIFVGNTGTAISAGSPSDFSVMNCTVAGNHAFAGPGGLAVIRLGNVASDMQTVTGSIFFGNTSDNSTGVSDEVLIDANRVTYRNCIIEDWPGDPSGIDVIDADPLFVDPLGPDGVAASGDEDYALQPGSPAIEFGYNLALPLDTWDADDNGRQNTVVPIDFAGNPRAADADGDGVFRADAGAFEFAGPVSPCRWDLTTAGAATGDAEYGTPDGTISNADLQFFLHQWLDRTERANIVSRNILGFGPPDCEVTVSDLQFYVNRWVAGCF